MRFRPAPSALSIGLLAIAAGCSSATTEQDVAWLVRHGRFDEAVARAEEASAADASNAALADSLRLARTAERLDEGRTAVFEGDLAVGLELMLEAEALDPGNPAVVTWVAKAHRELAHQFLDDAQRLASTDRLLEALEAYESALVHAPGDVSAKLGASRILLRINYREHLTERYYREGLEAFEQLALAEADMKLRYGAKYSPDNPDVAARLLEVEAMLASERLAKARGLEELGLFAAARNDFRMVLLLDPDNVEALEGRDRMDREARAQRKLVEGEMKVIKGDLDEASTLLEASERLSSAQADEIGQVRGALDDKRWRAMYDVAKALELDDRYPDAIAAYEELLVVAEYYEDAIARKETLQSFVELAEEKYPLALAAEDELDAATMLREIWVFWPRYKDVAERLKAIADGFVARADAATDDAAKLGFLRTALDVWPDFIELEDRIAALEAPEEPGR